MTRDWFDRQMARLMVLPFPPESIDEHWLALKHVPPQVFGAAIGHALSTRTRFPVPAELLMDCDRVKRPHAEAVHPTSRTVPIEGGIQVEIRNPFGGKSIHLTVTDAYRADCDDCDDTGHVLFWCGADGPTKMPWTYRRSCERRHPDGWTGGHDWAAECPCVATNVTIQRRKASQQVKFASEPETVRR